MNGQAIIRGALDLLYPAALYCSVCGNLIDSTRTYHLCDHCIRHIRWDREPAREADGLRMLRCAEYGLYERSLIFSLKYQGNRYLARDIAEMMRDRLAQAGEPFDVIVPIPLHQRKERVRGFNQAALIGRFLAAGTGTVLLPHALLRLRETRPMRGLSPQERERNIQGAFCLQEEAGEKLRGARVLLLDDFATTGATGREAMRALLPAGPQDVLFLSFAAKYGDAIFGEDAGGEETEEKTAASF